MRLPPPCLSVLACLLLAAVRAAAQTPAFTPSPPAERTVGIAYGLWHQSPNWGSGSWGTPALGTYASSNRAVIRQHAAQLADAGVDFILLDWSNDIGYTFDPAKPRADFDMIEGAAFAVFDEFAKMRAEGRRTPNVSILAGVTGSPAAADDGRLQRKADQIWNQFVANPAYRPLWQQYEGKPFLPVYVNTPSPFPNGTPKWSDARFTVRWMTGFLTQQSNLLAPGLVSKYGYWSWEDRGAQTFPIFENHPEAMVITAAIRGQNKPGERNYIADEGRQNGAIFRRQWARVRQLGPRFALVVSWNEWHRGEQPSAEVSKDVEPSKEFGALYLNLLKEETAKFKTGN